MRHRLCWLLVCAFAWFSARAVAQEASEPEYLSREELGRRVAAVRAEIAEQHWEAARKLIAALAATGDGVGTELDCEWLVISLNTGDGGYAPNHVFQVPTDLLSRSKRKEHDQCAKNLGLGYAAALARGGLTPEVAEGVAIQAAYWLSVAIKRSSELSLREAYARIPEHLRQLVQKELYRARKLEFRTAVGEQQSLEALSRAIAMQVWWRNPTTYPHCEADPVYLFELKGSDADRVHIIRCLISLPEGAYDETSYFVEPTPQGTYQVVTQLHETGYSSCGGEIWDKVSFTYLTPATHGFDGYLYVWRNGEARGRISEIAERQTATVASVCSRASGRCRHFEVGSTLCARPEARSTEPYQCAEDWEGVPRVQAGKLTLTAAEHTALGQPSGPLPRKWTRALRLRPTAGTVEPPSGWATPERAKRACWFSVSQPESGVSVWSHPSNSAKSLGSLPAGAVARSLGKRSGFYRIDAPVAGWVKSSEVSSTCP